MMERLKALAARGADFAFETTLASRTFAPWIRELIERGYEFSLAFLWLPSSDMAVRRVRERVRAGGHSVPEETIRRRYESGLRNFFRIYRPLASNWRFYENSNLKGPRLLASGRGSEESEISDPRTWKAIKKRYES